MPSTSNAPRRTARLAIASTAFAVVLTACVGASGTGPEGAESAAASAVAGADPVVSTDALFPDDVDAFGDDLELMAEEAFVVADPEVEALGVVSWAAEGTVQAIEDAPAELEGAMVVTVEVSGIAWADEVRWNLGSPEPVVTPGGGEVVRLLADDIWQLSTGDQVLLAVAIEPNPDGAYGGFAEFLATPEGQVLPTRRGVSEVRRLVADRLRDAGDRAAGRRASRRAALLELLGDASARIDAINQGDEVAPPPGLLGEVVAATPASELAQGVPFAEQDPDWRQLPTSDDEASGVADAVPGRVAEAAVLITVDLDPLPSFVALQLPGAGLVGPVNVDPFSSSAALNPFMPVNGAVRVLGWYDDEPAPDTAVVLAGLQPLEPWDPAADGLVVRVDGSGAVIEPMPYTAFEAELTRIAELGAEPPTGEP